MKCASENPYLAQGTLWNGFVCDFNMDRPLLLGLLAKIKCHIDRPSVKLKVLVTQLCPALCDPMDYSPPGSSVYGDSPGRTLEWAAMSYSRGFPNSGIKPRSPALQADSLPSELLKLQLKWGSGWSPVYWRLEPRSYLWVAAGWTLESWALFLCSTGFLGILVGFGGAILKLNLKSSICRISMAILATFSNACFLLESFFLSDLRKQHYWINENKRKHLNYFNLFLGFLWPYFHNGYQTIQILVYLEGF